MEDDSAYDFFTPPAIVAGNTLICGPTGTGKSVLLAAEVATHLRNPEAQAFVFEGDTMSMLPLCLLLGGRYYDGMGDSLAEGIVPELSPERFQVFGGSFLLDDRRDGARITTALRVLDRIERCLDGRPTLIALDPIWRLRPLWRSDWPEPHQALAVRLRELLQTANDRGAAVILTAQEPMDLEEVGMGDGWNVADLGQLCPIKIFTAQHGLLLSSSLRHSYAALGLDDYPIVLIARDLPRWAYCVVGPFDPFDDFWPLSLTLTPSEQAFIGVSDPEKLKRAREFHAFDSRFWPAIWLHAQGVPMDAPPPRWLVERDRAALTRSREIFCDSLLPLWSAEIT